MIIIQILIYLSLIVFIALCIIRIVKLFNSPVHLRWELYPVPHEKGKSKYGGSRLEEVNWWEKPPQKSWFGEIKATLSEMLFLKGVFENNRKLWYASYPFHLGLYLFIINIFLLIITSIIDINKNSINYINSSILVILYWKIYIIAWVASIIGLVGSVRLLIMRIFDKGMKFYSNWSHYFNIILIGLLYLTALLWLATDNDIIYNLIDIYTALITFSLIPSIPLIGILHFSLLILFLFYLPLTHMTHFFTKYFTYHKVRWDDAQIEHGSKIEKTLYKQLNQIVSWAAPHIAADGKSNWIDLATGKNSNEEKPNE
jgi:nitrate reductase gamma subunit